jgi:16S rRNA A1518/A1519 N6-dimethyltransferase RsmA/KsgA/DIM1 with predicted DNA glycosylase/AP lyase activity
MLELFFLILNLLFAVYLIYYIVAFLSGAPFVPSTNPTAESMIKLAQLKKGMVCYDLGSGEGKLLKRIASYGAKAIGVEINPLLVLYSKIRFLTNPLISVLWQSFWTTNLSDADVIFVYLLPLRMEKLKTKLMKECKKGTLIISNSFIFPDWKIMRQDAKNHVYIFRI